MSRHSSNIISSNQKLSDSPFTGSFPAILLENGDTDRPKLCLFDQNFVQCTKTIRYIINLGHMNEQIIEYRMYELLNNSADPYAKIFDAYPSFNGVQSTVFDSIVHKDDSVVVTAPTGSGKTTIFELAIVRLLMNPGDGNFKVVYMAPVKALCSERFSDWESKFRPLGVRCALVTGDTDVDGDVTDLNNVQHVDLVVTTPEKWDFLTRRWRDHQQLMNSVRLFLIDEVHLLNDKSRGHVLEAVVSRMKMIQHQQMAVNRLRFIAVSATVANTRDLAAWLGTLSEPSLSYAFGEEMRPVKLNKVVKGYDLQAKDFRFDLNLSYKVESVLKEYSEGKPALIFCSTRKSVLQTAQVLSQMVTFTLNEEQRKQINAACELIVEGKLRDLVRCGIAYHHAGMPQSDRIAIEDVFRKGYLPVLIATSTLAMGVNLPAHLVILKNTQFYNQGGYEEYSDNQILQMIGRAGRPQFDSSATAVIMTRRTCAARFERLVSGCDPVRSWLQNQIVEHLNAEIVLGSVRNLDDAVEWLKSTFYWVCAVRQPKKYGLPVDLSPEEIEVKLQDMIKKELSELESYGLVKLVDNFETKKTPYGRIMARYYVSFDTMKLFLGMTGRESLVQLLDLITRCAELRDVTLRMHEKKPLNNLNGDSFNGLRFPLPGRIVNKYMKINCLIQAVLGSRSLPEYSLIQDSLRIVRVSQRLSRCLHEVTAEKGFMSAQRSAAILAKCLRCQMWEDSPMVARQLPRIGPALSGLLVAAGKTTLDSLATANPRDLERIMNRFPPMGDEVQRSAASIARLQVHVVRTGTEVLEVKVTRRVLDNHAVGNDHQHWFDLIVGGSDNKLFFQKRFAASDVGFPIEDEWTDINNAALSFEIYLKDPLPTKVHAFLISEMWVGVDSSTTLVLKDGLEGADFDDFYCDVPYSLQSVDTFYGSKEKSAASKKAPAKPRGAAAKKAAATPAPKTTPAPSALKRIPPVKKPAAQQMSSTDIRRFFPTAKPSKAPKQRKQDDSGAFNADAVDSTTEDYELPMGRRPRKSVFDELRKDEASSQAHKPEASPSSPEVIDCSPEIRMLMPEAIFVKTNHEFDSLMNEDEDRIIDCGFEAFMAGLEKNTEKDDDEVQIIESTSRTDIVRPEPRCFGNDLTNMPSTSRINQQIQVDERSVSYQPLKGYPCDRPNRPCVENDSVDDDPLDSAQTRSEEVPTNPSGKSGRISGGSRDAISTIGHSESPENDGMEFGAFPKNPYREPNRIPNGQYSEFVSTIGQRENALIDGIKFNATPEKSNDKKYEKYRDFVSTDGHRNNVLIDSSKLDAVSENFSLNPNTMPKEEYSNFMGTVLHNESPWSDRTNFDTVSNHFSDRILNEEYSMFSSRIGQEESPWSDETKFDALSKHSFDKLNSIPKEECSYSVARIDYTESPWSDRTKFNAVSKSSYDRIPNEEYTDFSYPIGHKENALNNRTKFDSNPKKSHDKPNRIPNQEYIEFSSRIGQEESPWSDETKFDAVPKKSNDKINNRIFNEDCSDSVAGIDYKESPWSDGTKIDTVLKNSYEGTPNEECWDFTSSICHRENAPINRTNTDKVTKNSYITPDRIPNKEFIDFEVRNVYKDNSWPDRTKIDTVSENSYDRIPNEEYIDFPIRHRDNVVVHRTNFDSVRPNRIPEVEPSDPIQTNGRRESMLIHRTNFDAELKTSYNKPNTIFVEDDGEFNLRIGQRPMPPRVNSSVYNASRNKSPILDNRGLQSQSEPRRQTPSGTCTTANDVFPIIDSILDNITKKDDSRDGLYVDDNNPFAITDEYSSWDGQHYRGTSSHYSHTETKNKVHSVGWEKQSGPSTPNSRKRLSGNDEPHSWGNLDRGWRSCIQDSGFPSMYIGSSTTPNYTTERQRLKKDVAPRKSVIAELGLESLLGTGDGTQWSGNVSSRENAWKAFDSLLSREASVQPPPSSQDRSNIPPSPWARNRGTARTPRSNLQRTSIEKTREGSTPLHKSFVPTPTVPWATPRLSRLTERSYKLAHSDHIRSSFESVVLSVKSESGPVKHHKTFDSGRPKKRARLVSKTKTADPIPLPSPVPVTSSKSLPNEPAISQCFENAIKTTTPSTVTNTPESDQNDGNSMVVSTAVLENFNDVQLDERDKPNLSLTPPRFSKTDQTMSDTDRSSLASEISDPVLNCTTESIIVPKVPKDPQLVPSPSRHLQSLNESDRSQETQLYAISPNIPSTAQNVDKVSFSSPNKPFRAPVYNRTNQQHQLFNVSNPKSFHNTFVGNVNKVPQIPTSFSNRERPTKMRFIPPLRKS